MERNVAILTDDICDEIISGVYDSQEYQAASSYLESEIIKLLGEDELKWAKHNDAYMMLENSVVRKAVEIGYALGKADKQSIEVVATAL
ncbi:hypothetical protein [Alicyclobacillus ferrooxydans]|uniref:Uncharacterized protein n=1 Tax=Alicyclobacillus ferrooxydans TaxID=471514 RepID=A0A0P9D877_9BACL|nr:hypothetical protein [Alicyclobacillus ferrooxydans]KPV45497.1 hypothetical protein AN477_00605 [Alicyclobacillus ferrooxydans]